jgi:hypothetical protein
MSISEERSSPPTSTSESRSSEGATPAGLIAGLRDAGYREGENIVIDSYYADGQEALLAARGGRRYDRVTAEI